MLLLQEVHWVILMWCCTVRTCTYCILRWSSRLPLRNTWHQLRLRRPTLCYLQDFQPLESSWCKFCRDCRQSISELHTGREVSLPGQCLVRIVSSQVHRENTLLNLHHVQFFFFFFFFFYWLFTTHLLVLTSSFLRFRDHTQWHSPLQRPVADKHTTLTTDKHPCPRWDSNPQSQQASGCRPTP